ncbi:MAG: peptidoglycan-binding domain-containing protein [Polyangiaceae bacterium]
MSASTPYVVRAGDYLDKLAYSLGFDRDAVWQSDENKELRELRKDGNILLPGDVLMVPPPSAAPPPIEGGSSNTYAAEVPKVEVRVVFVDLTDEILANEPCEVPSIPDAPTATDGDGRLTLQVPVTMRQVEVRFPNKEMVLALDIGGLDPHADDSGIKQRLANLGLYLDGDADEDEALSLSIKVFQRLQGLPETGELDDATRAKLLSIHRV